MMLELINPHRPEYLPVIEEARAPLFGDHRPADAVVGDEALFQPGYLIELRRSRSSTKASGARLRASWRSGNRRGETG